MEDNFKDGDPKNGPLWASAQGAPKDSASVKELAVDFVRDNNDGDSQYMRHQEMWEELPTTDKLRAVELAQYTGVVDMDSFDYTFDGLRRVDRKFICDVIDEELENLRQFGIRNVEDSLHYIVKYEGQEARYIDVFDEPLDKLPRRGLQWACTNQGMPTYGQMYWAKDKAALAEMLDTCSMAQFEDGKRVGGMLPAVESVVGNSNKISGGLKRIGIEIEAWFAEQFNIATPVDREDFAPLFEFIELQKGGIKRGIANVQVKKLKYSDMMEYDVSQIKKTKLYDKATGTINISNVTYIVERSDGTIIRFNPYNELLGAMDCIKTGRAMTFEQEYAVESLWHEVLHAKSFGWRDAETANYGGIEHGCTEILTQFCARMSYDKKFLRAGKGVMSHANEILEHGLGYNDRLQSFRDAIKKCGISDEAAFRYFENKLTSTYFEDMAKLMQGFFEKYLPKDEAAEIVRMMV